MLKDDPFANDPFFKRGPSRVWTACIGQQGDEYSYVMGYMQAADELVAAVIDKKQFARRDTLVLPILYTVRHAIELALKFSARRLVASGLVTGPVRANHDVGALWRMLHDADLGDRTLRATLSEMKPFIDSVTAIDSDGQELRYHRNNADDPSLAKYSIANLEVIRASLAKLAPHIDTLLFRTLKFLEERETGTFTTRCSRMDLFQIVEMLPPLADWKDARFDNAKFEICKTFNLSNRAFCLALNVIKAHREMRAILGEETPFRYLTEPLIIDCITEWRKLHPKIEADTGLGLVLGSDISFEMMMKQNKLEDEVVAALLPKLSPEQFGELAAIFFLSRDDEYSEDFDRLLEANKEKYIGADGPAVQIVYLFEKTNLLDDLIDGAERLGQPRVAESLSAL